MATSTELFQQRSNLERDPQAYQLPFRIAFDELQWSESTKQDSNGQSADKAGLSKPYKVERTAQQDIIVNGATLHVAVTEFQIYNAGDVVRSYSCGITVRDAAGQPVTSGTTYVSVMNTPPFVEITLTPPTPLQEPADPAIVSGLYANLVRTLPELARQSGKAFDHAERLNRTEPGLDAVALENMLTAAGYKKIEDAMPVPKMVRNFQPDAGK